MSYSVASQIHHVVRPHLGHEFETPFYPGQGLLVQDAGLIGRHNGWVDEAQEHGAAHRTNAVLREPLTHHLCGMEGAGTDRWGKRGTDGGEERFEQREGENIGDGFQYIKEQRRG